MRSTKSHQDQFALFKKLLAWSSQLRTATATSQVEAMIDCALCQIWANSQGEKKPCRGEQLWVRESGSCHE